MSATKDEQAIRNLYTAWRQATLTEDLPTILKLITDDAVFLVPGEPPIKGKEQFAQMFETVRGKYQIEAQSEFDEIDIHGDQAYVLSRLAVSMKPKSGGTPQVNSGHTLTILRKNAQGSWAVSRDANLLALQHMS